MSYRISYDPESTGKEKQSYFFRAAMTLTFFLIFVWSVTRYWPEGRELLKMLVIPGDPDATLQAAEVFARELQTGQNIGEAARRLITAVLSYETAG